MPQNYTAPLSDIKFILNKILNLKDILELSCPDIGVDVVDSILEEAAKFASNELSPLNQTGDSEGCKFKDGAVTTPKGFKEAYSKFINGGWNAVPFSPEYGGQGLPWLVAVAISEMWNGANMAFSLCPLLTQGAVEALTHHGSGVQKDKYLAKLISGEWTGTMCLTEPQAGSDLAAIRTKATPNGDHYLIKGQKIFITYGEHDFTDNIIHMVLARTPDAPEGVKGISLFIVPKFLDNNERNDLHAISIEHKLGIHASPTAVMQFGEKNGAIGYLVGEENHGLKYMFTMMNNARLSVGVEGLGISENSYQQAFAYAKERVQGRSIKNQELRKLESKEDGNPSLIPDSNFLDSIINHPDVSRMLLTIRAHTEASRAIVYYVARSMDLAKYHGDEKIRQVHQDIVDLLTPVAKAHATELGFANASMAMQVFGGVGYIEETGIAQNLRDARIAMIYEGTNGIQAMDLVMRKLNLHDGRLVESLKQEVSSESCMVSSLYAEGGNITPGAPNDPLSAIEDSLFTTTTKMQKLAKDNPEQAGMLATPYLRLFGLAMGGILLNDSLNVANDDNALPPEFVASKKEAVEFYNKYILPEVDFIKGVIEG